jgi:structural maintenance of chromosome 2
MKDEVANAEMKVGEVKANHDEARQTLDNIEERMTHISGEVVALKRERTDLEKLCENATLEAKKLNVNIARIKKERLNAEAVVSSLKKKYPWIESEISAFGIAGGDYDFQAADTNEIAKTLKKLKAEQETLVS